METESKSSVTRAGAGQWGGTAMGKGLLLGTTSLFYNCFCCSTHLPASTDDLEQQAGAVRVHRPLPRIFLVCTTGFSKCVLSSSDFRHSTFL